MLGIAAIPSHALVFGILVMPESPGWLVMQGRLENARNVLSKISDSEEEVEMRFQNIKVVVGVDENDSNKETIKFTEKNNGGGVWKELVVRPTYAVRWMLLAAIGIQFFEHATGIEAIMGGGIRKWSGGRGERKGVAGVRGGKGVVGRGDPEKGLRRWEERRRGRRPRGGREGVVGAGEGKDETVVGWWVGGRQRP
ncbi:hypothetical protein Fmac_017672 [Flemingia macrophylla]|uniref:Polyol transporter n=1 Tax=Flemingia macrophylla TaxID=520843 RepID=A0ABD1M2Y9_9FABA